MGEKKKLWEEMEDGVSGAEEEEEEQLERHMPPAFTLLEGTGTLALCLPCLYEIKCLRCQMTKNKFPSTQTSLN